MPAIEFSQARTYEDLSRALAQIHPDQGRAIVQGNSVNYGAHSVNYEDLKIKIQQIYEHLKTTDEIKVEEYRQLSALMYEIQDLSEKDTKTKVLYNRLFVKDQLMSGIRDECIHKIHDNSDLMNLILKQYDDDARVLNELIKTNASENDTRDLLSRLKYLNTIIGLEWNSMQLTGKAPVPLWMEEKSVGYAMPKSLKINDCQRLSALNELLKYVNENERVGRFRDKLALPGFGDFLFRDFENKIRELVTKETNRFPFAKSEIAYEAYLLINQLKLINPHSSARKSSLDDMEATCLNVIRQDQTRMKVIRKQFNSLAKSSNRNILYNFINRANYNLMDPSFAHDVKILGKILDIPLSHEHLSRQALIPRAVKSDQKYNISDLIQYNTYRSLINHEIDLREKINELKSLQWQIDSKNISSSLLSKETKDEISERMMRLCSWICDKFINVSESNSHYQLAEQLDSYKMPEPMFKSMLATCEGIARQVERPLNVEQSSGAVYLPEIQYQYQIKRENYFLQLDDLTKVNRMIGVVNWQNKLRILHERYENLRDLLKIDMAFTAEGPGILNEMQRIEDEIEVMTKKSPLLESFSTHRSFINWLNQQFLPFYRANGCQPLNEEQIKGVEEIPLIDLEKLPLPDREKLVRDYESLSNIDRYWLTIPKVVQEKLDEDQASNIPVQSHPVVDEVNLDSVEIEPSHEHDDFLQQSENNLKTDLLHLRFVKLDPNWKGHDVKTLADSVMARMEDLFAAYKIQEPMQKLDFIEKKLNLTKLEREHLSYLLCSNLSDEDFMTLMTEMELDQDNWVPPPEVFEIPEWEKIMQLRYQMLMCHSVSSSNQSISIPS